MLSDHALALIRDIFDRQDLFRDAPHIRKRMVAWGPDSQCSRWIIPPSLSPKRPLLRELRPGLLLDADAGAAPSWTIFASRPLPAPAEEHPFGTRMASADRRDPEGRLRARSMLDRIAGGRMAVPDPNAHPDPLGCSRWARRPDALLAASRVIREQIAEANRAAASFRHIRELCRLFRAMDGWPAAPPQWHSIRSAATEPRTPSAKRSWLRR